MPNRINFGQLVRTEPELLVLLNDAANYDKRGKAWGELSTIWYREFKPRMSKLVGMHTRKEGLITTCAAYDCAYETICSCLTGESF
jgi:hypothetical protein